MNTTKNAPPVIECFHLRASDFQPETNQTVIVKTQRASNYKVERRAAGMYVIYGNDWRDGMTCVYGVDMVRDTLLTR